MVHSRTFWGRSLLLGACLLTGVVGCGGAGAIGLGTLDDAESPATQDRVAAVALTPDNQDEIIRDVISGVNRQRARHSTADSPLGPLSPDLKLAEIADEYAKVMIEDGFFSHQHPATGDGPDARAIACGYAGKAIGENLAVGLSTPAEVVEAWMESPDHRAAILDPQWREIGIGVRLDRDHGLFWVCEFGAPR